MALGQLKSLCYAATQETFPMISSNTVTVIRIFARTLKSCYALSVWRMMAISSCRYAWETCALVVMVALFVFEMSFVPFSLLLQALGLHLPPRSSERLTFGWLGLKEWKRKWKLL